MSRSSAERKEAARQFLKDHVGSGQRTKTRAFYDDDPDEIIPNRGPRGPRGRKRLSALYKPVTPSIRTPSISSFPRHEAAKIVVDDIASDSTGMPVILDTSVVVEGLFSLQTGSPSRRLMELALADGEEIVPYVTSAIVYEYKRVLEMFGDDRLEHLYRLLFKSIVIPVLSDIEIPPVEADPFDTPFVQALVLAMRGLKGNQQPLSRLVTKDHHLLNMVKATDSVQSLNGRIVTPAQVLWELHR